MVRIIMHNVLQKNYPIFILLLVHILLADYLQGQEITYNYYYRVYFRDKGENGLLTFKSIDLLSERAIKRREKAGIAVPSLNDIPVFKEYLKNISNLGFRLHCTSKWINSAVFKTELPSDINLLLSLPFVQDVKVVKRPSSKSQFRNKLDFTYELSDSPAFDRPISMIGGIPLHNSGYNGQDILIAVLDGGFQYADKATSLSNLINSKRIKSTYDFVRNNAFVYNYSNHGTAVLSVLAGKLPGLIEGTAPGSDYLLLRTEDTSSEFPVEEDFWTAGAEYADSAGADIISSSLGYFQFDDPSLNYKYSDMDGNTAFITRAAEIAASKGMMIFNSAGNERDRPWTYLIAPSDGKKVVAVGAVDGNNLISTFSSSGPSADGRVKPDNAVMGVSIPVQADQNTIIRSSGTSFSCPVLSGITACLMQAVPKAINTDIIQVLHSSADRFDKPDALYGYGMPDMINALLKLQDKYVKIPDNEIMISPNPTNGEFDITFRQPPVRLVIEIYTFSGRSIYRTEFPEFAGRIITINELQDMEQGIYIVRIICSNGIFVDKVIKLRK
jgi:serine protease AprX